MDNRNGIIDENLTELNFDFDVSLAKISPLYKI